VEEVISVDVVTRPATNKTLFESDHRMKTTVKKLIEANFKPERIKASKLLEMEGMEDMPVEMEAEASPDDQIWGAFQTAILAAVNDETMDVDVEVCGTDQTFNALAGRTLQKRLKNKDKFVVALNLIANPKTGELMSKSNGTGVFINLPPNEMFGAIMSLPDPMIEPLYIHCTRLPLDQKEQVMQMGPRKAKALVAQDIVKRFHGESKALEAEQAFDNTFSKGVVPEDVEEIKLSAGESLSQKLIEKGIVPSKAEWKRLIDGGAVRTESDQKIEDSNFIPTQTMVLKIGKRRFVRVTI
jgi:tyrosyl-tRNA synthetase